MIISCLEPFLAQLIAKSQTPGFQIIVLVTSSEADAQKVETILRTLGGDSLKADSILYFPGLVQAGVFRFESARRVLAKRIGALQALSRRTPEFIVCSVNSFLRMTPKLEWLTANSILLKPGTDLDFDTLLVELERMAYSPAQKVEDVGEYVIRGSILDIWTPGQKTPSRIEIFGDEIEKIRAFRVADQRSFAVLDELAIVPAREFVWPSGDSVTFSQEKFNDKILGHGLSGSVRMDLLENLTHHVPFPGIDDVFPLFSKGTFQGFSRAYFEKMNTSKDTTSILLIDEKESLSKALDELEKTYLDAYSSSRMKGFLSGRVEEVFPDISAFKTLLQSSPFADSFLNVPLKIVTERELSYVPIEEIKRKLTAPELKKFAHRANLLATLLNEKQIGRLLILSKSEDGFSELAGVLSKYFPGLENIPEDFKLENFNAVNLTETHLSLKPVFSNFYAARADIDSYFYIPGSDTLVVSDMWLQGVQRSDQMEIFTEEESKEASRAASETLMAAQFGDFTEGDLVVHMQHGIARYRGITTLTVMEITADFLTLEYAGNDKVYVPIHKMNLVQKYVGAAREDNSVLDALKGASWEKRKAKAKADAEKLARDLMEHQAKRAMTPGHAFVKIDENYVAFEAAFPYDETPDQQRAVREIMSDMSKPKAMDRLLCGDVGFGKTEVAMRAAFRAILDGKQVAFLVPTTVLAHQHLRSLKERFEGFGVEIKVLDRSVSGQAGNKVLEILEKGNVDILVGTHRILSKDIKFRDLGLLIVDEEQRFGVLQKEKIKTMAYGIDVLTMTATPIPRTLQMAMLGLRDLSLLTTPPKARLAIKTFVCPHDENIIKDAIQFELNRGGQIFFVHNRVDELKTVEEYLQGLLPHVRIGIGHGKMSQKELEDTMVAFIDNKFDILLCTTIIESGIDMPNVNTILIQNADHFGLSQLYQMRGRVGRRSSRGYAYYLTSPNAKEEDEGMKRLDILKEHQDLGSGFIIASHDLEMRGAGNILGDEQNGRVSDVGLETYSQMLDDAIKALGGIKSRAQVEVEIQLPLLSQIPEDYIQNSKDRLRFYRRFFGARSEDALQNLVAECEDRFGPLPDQVKNLAELARLRRWLMVVGATALIVKEDVTEVRLGKDILQSTDEDSETLFKRILDVCNRHTRGVRLSPDGRLLINIRKKQFLQSPHAPIAELKRFLSLLAGERHEEK